MSTKFTHIFLDYFKSQKVKSYYRYIPAGIRGYSSLSRGMYLNTNKESACLINSEELKEFPRLFELLQKKLQEKNNDLHQETLSLLNVEKVYFKIHMDSFNKLKAVYLSFTDNEKESGIKGLYEKKSKIWNILNVFKKHNKQDDDFYEIKLQDLIHENHHYSDNNAKSLEEGKIGLDKLMFYNTKISGEDTELIKKIMVLMEKNPDIPFADILSKNNDNLDSYNFFMMRMLKETASLIFFEEIVLSLLLEIDKDFDNIIHNKNTESLYKKIIKTNDICINAALNGILTKAIKNPKLIDLIFSSFSLSENYYYPADFMLLNDLDNNYKVFNKYLKDKFDKKELSIAEQEALVGFMNLLNHRSISHTKLKYSKEVNYFYVNYYENLNKTTKLLNDDNNAILLDIIADRVSKTDSLNVIDLETIRAMDNLYLKNKNFQTYCCDNLNKSEVNIEKFIRKDGNSFLLDIAEIYKERYLLENNVITLAFAKLIDAVASVIEENQKININYKNTIIQYLINSSEEITVGVILKKDDVHIEIPFKDSVDKEQTKKKINMAIQIAFNLATILKYKKFDDINSGKNGNRQMFCGAIAYESQEINYALNINKEQRDVLLEQCDIKNLINTHIRENILREKLTINANTESKDTFSMSKRKI